MASSINYEKNSIVNIGIDTKSDVFGDVTDNTDGTITMSNNSAFELTYEYNTDTKRLWCDYMKIEYMFTSDLVDLSTTYNDDIKIHIILDYYTRVEDEDTGEMWYEDGSQQNICIMPYLKHESEGYTNTLETEVLEDYLRMIRVRVEYNSDVESTITINKLNLHNSLTTEQLVVDTIGRDIEVRMIEEHPNGMVVFYHGDYEPSTILFLENELEQFVGIKVNPGTDKEIIVDYSRFDDLL